MWKCSAFCVTTGASKDACSHDGRESDTQLLLWPILFPFRYLGYQVYQPEVMHGVGGVAFIEELAGGLNTLEPYSNQWRQTLETLASRPFIEYNRDAHFDERTRLLPDAPVYSPFVRHNPDALG